MLHLLEVAGPRLADWPLFEGGLMKASKRSRSQVQLSLHQLAPPSCSDHGIAPGSSEDTVGARTEQNEGLSASRSESHPHQRPPPSRDRSLERRYRDFDGHIGRSTGPADYVRESSGYKKSPSGSTRIRPHNNGSRPLSTLPGGGVLTRSPASSVRVFGGLKRASEAYGALVGVSGPISIDSLM